MKNLKTIILAMAAMLSSALAFSQISVVNQTDATILANALIGSESGITIVSATFTGSETSSGTFSGGLFGISEGILLTTGLAQNAVGPNSSGSVGYDHGAAGDADLDAIIAPYETNDAAVLEITFVPAGNSLEFIYVFGSEEYNTFVCSDYNDAFAFIVNGGAYTNQNIAIIPGTSPPMPVTINNVNNGSVGFSGDASNCSDAQLANTAFFVDNDLGANIEYDGHTVPMTAVIAVQPGTQYTIKLAIADAADGILDSGVFIEGHSFVSVACDAGEVTFLDTDNTTVDICTDNLPATIEVENNGEGSNDQYSYIVTNAEGTIYTVTESGSISTDQWLAMTYKIYGISYSGNLTGMDEGANIDDISADGCYEIDGPLTVIIQECVEEFECPGLSANKGDACDDDNEGTVNDMVTADCQCVGTPATHENTAASCSDGIDNDGDGLTDCEDPDCQAIANNIGCLTCFEDGLSFADEVIDYVSNCTNNISTDPTAALGMPDYTGNSTQHATLGRGYIKLGFTNNTLVNSGTTDADLFVFEVGPLIESSFIELRPSNAATEALCIAAGIMDSDGDGFYEFGGIGGALAAVDIDAFFDNLPPSSVFFDAIKIVDGPGGCATSTPGADIDGVCALSSIACAVGSPCDDGNPDTENDVINADCQCEGTPITIEYDCLDLSANIGDACPLDGSLGIINADCQCVPVIVPSCNYVYYLSDHAAADGISEIYQVTLSGGIATMMHIATSETEVHIAYNSADHYLYAISKYGNTFRKLNPHIPFPVFEPPVSFNQDLGEITTAVFNHDGKLVIGSQTTKKVYIVNVNVDPVSVAVFESNVPVYGGDLAFDSSGKLYLATRSGNGLHEVWPNPMLLSILPPKVTGMAITDADQLLISAQGNSAIVVRNTPISTVLDETAFDLMLNGEAYTLRDGDMASGCYQPPTDEGYCENFTTFLANHGAGINGSNIYTVNFSGGMAHLNPLTTVAYETHIAFNANADILYLVNVDGSFFQTYHVASKSFMGQVNITGNLDKITAVVFNPNDGLLYVGDHIQDKIYTIHTVTGAAVEYANAPVSGGDLEILDNGTLYLGTKQGSDLYTIVAASNASRVGSMVPNVTGMARANDAINAFITSNNGANQLTKIDATGATIDTYPIMLGGLPFTLTDGDMAAGCHESSGGLEGDCTNYKLFYIHQPQGGGQQPLLEVTLHSNGTATYTTVLANLGGHMGASPDGNTIFAVVGNKLKTIDVPTKTITTTRTIKNAGGTALSGFPAVVVSHDGTIYAARSNDNQVYTIDPVLAVATPYGPSRNVNGGDLIESSGQIWLINRNHNTMTNVLTGSSFTVPPTEINGAAVLGNGNILVADGNGGSLLKEVDISTHLVVKTYDIGLPLFNGDLAGVCVERETSFENGDCYATEVIEYVQGTSKGGGSIALNRTDPTKALGAPQRTGGIVFVSLGYGGSLTLAFNGAIPNGIGDDIEIVETSFGNPSCTAYPEYADVYLSVNGTDWHYATTVCRTSGFVDIDDAGPFPYVNFVKLVNNNTQSTTHDGFDVDGVVALHNCTDQTTPPTSPITATIAETASTLTTYPNPTNGPSKVVFTTGETTPTLVEVYDMNGRNVATLFNQEAQKGEQHTLDFNGSTLPNGVYIYRMTTNNETIIQKFMIAR